MVGRHLSFWNRIFSGAILNFLGCMFIVDDQLVHNVTMSFCLVGIWCKNHVKHVRTSVFSSLEFWKQKKLRSHCFPVEGLCFYIVFFLVRLLFPKLPPWAFHCQHWDEYHGNLYHQSCLPPLDPSLALLEWHLLTQLAGSLLVVTVYHCWAYIYI